MKQASSATAIKSKAMHTPLLVSTLLYLRTVLATSDSVPIWFLEFQFIFTNQAILSDTSTPMLLRYLTSESLGTWAGALYEGQGTKNFDFSVVKNWKMRDQYRIQFRAKMFNAFNHPNFRAVDTNLSFNNIAGDENFGKPLNRAFGVLNGTRGAREIQFGLKFSF
jgi:hypothetical protein